MVLGMNGVLISEADVLYFKFSSGFPFDIVQFQHSVSIENTYQNGKYRLPISFLEKLGYLAWASMMSAPWIKAGV